jgi:hypothetical protein
MDWTSSASSRWTRFTVWTRSRVSSSRRSHSIRNASSPAQRRLKVTVNGPDRTRTVNFSRSIARVYLTLTNASIRYTCWRGTGLSCTGVPSDDGLQFAYSARAMR